MGGACSFLWCIKFFFPNSLAVLSVRDPSGSQRKGLSLLGKDWTEEQRALLKEPFRIYDRLFRGGGISF